MLRGGEKTQKKQKDTERKKDRRSVSSAWKERKQRRQLHRNSPLQSRERSTTLSKNWEKNMKLSEEKSCKKGTSSSQVTPQNSKLIVCKAIWNHMFPKSKYKMVRSLKVSPEIPKGLNRAIGMEIGLIFPTLMKSARKMRRFSNEKGYSLNAKRWQEHFQTQRKWYLIFLKRERKYLPGTA